MKNQSLLTFLVCSGLLVSNLVSSFPSSFEINHQKNRTLTQTVENNTVTDHFHQALVKRKNPGSMDFDFSIVGDDQSKLSNQKKKEQQQTNNQNDEIMESEEEEVQEDQDYPTDPKYAFPTDFPKLTYTIRPLKYIDCSDIDPKRASTELIMEDFELNERSLIVWHDCPKTHPLSERQEHIIESLKQQHFLTQISSKSQVYVDVLARTVKHFSIKEVPNKQFFYDVVADVTGWRQNEPRTPRVFNLDALDDIMSSYDYDMGMFVPREVGILIEWNNKKRSMSSSNNNMNSHISSSSSSDSSSNKGTIEASQMDMTSKWFETIVSIFKHHGPGEPSQRDNMFLIHH